MSSGTPSVMVYRSGVSLCVFPERPNARQGNESSNWGCGIGPEPSLASSIGAGPLRSLLASSVGPAAPGMRRWCASARKKRARLPIPCKKDNDVFGFWLSFFFSSRDCRTWSRARTAAARGKRVSRMGGCFRQEAPGDACLTAARARICSYSLPRVPPGADPGCLLAQVGFRL